MRTRLGLVAGTGIVLAGPIAIAAYEASDKTMPDWLFTLIGSACAIVLILAIPTWTVAVLVVPAWHWLRGKRFQWPLAEGSKPHPSQAILDLASHDASEPYEQTYVTRARISSQDLSPELERPWIVIEVRFFNANLHTVVVGPVDGYVKFHNKELATKPEAKGRNRVAARTEGSYGFRQVLTPTQAAELRKEETRNPAAAGSIRTVQSLDLGGVELSVESEPQLGKGATGSKRLSSPGGLQVLEG